MPGRLRFDLEFSGVTLTTHGTSKSHHGGWRCLQNPRRFMPRIICAKRCHFPRSKLRANLTRPTQTSASHTPGCPNSQCTRSSRLGRMHPFGQKPSFAPHGFGLKLTFCSKQKHRTSTEATLSMSAVSTPAPRHRPAMKQSFLPGTPQVFHQQVRSHPGRRATKLSRRRHVKAGRSFSFCPHTAQDPFLSGI